MTRHRQAWLDALKSGNYQQGRFDLRPDADHYCCLGVACDVIDPGDWIFGVDSEEAEDEDPKYTWDGEDAHLKVISRGHVGITMDQEAILIRLNDQHHEVTFTDIAEIVEKNLFTYIYFADGHTVRVEESAHATEQALREEQASHAMS